jgi:hypothetical protein
MAPAPEEDHSTAGKGRAWKRRRNGLPNKKSAIGTRGPEEARKLENSRFEGSNWIDGIVVGSRVDEGLNYEDVRIRRWFQNQIRSRSGQRSGERCREGNGEASGAMF